jgi:hypothetical protein
LMFLKAEINIETDGYFDKKLLGTQRSSWTHVIGTDTAAGNMIISWRLRFDPESKLAAFHRLPAKDIADAIRVLARDSWVDHDLEYEMNIRNAAEENCCRRGVLDLQLQVLHRQTTRIRTSSNQNSVLQRSFLPGCRDSNSRAPSFLPWGRRGLHTVESWI